MSGVDHYPVRQEEPTVVSVSRMKASLSRFLKLVKSGKEITVTDRDRPIAMLVAYPETEMSLRILSPTRKASDLNKQLNLPPLKKRVKTDSLALLLEERR
jgi:antitoxin (DNA-binding transcriptional repressor) of toxin-antitoxin stability system